MFDESCVILAPTIFANIIPTAVTNIEAHREITRDSDDEAPPDRNPLIDKDDNAEDLLDSSANKKGLLGPGTRDRGHMLTMNPSKHSKKRTPANNGQEAFHVLCDTKLAGAQHSNTARKAIQLGQHICSIFQSRRRRWRQQRATAAAILQKTKKKQKRHNSESGAMAQPFVQQPSPGTRAIYPWGQRDYDPDADTGRDIPRPFPRALPRENLCLADHKWITHRGRGDNASRPASEKQAMTSAQLNWFYKKRALLWKSRAAPRLHPSSREQSLAYLHDFSDTRPDAELDWVDTGARH